MFKISFPSVISALLLASSANALSSEVSAGPPKKFYGGAGVGRLNLDSSESIEKLWKCKYDMVLVERLQGKPKTESGLFIPQDDLPKLHLGRVVTMGPGREEENGMIAPMPPIKPGDLVICKNPWGIGPKDEETADGKKLSFMRSLDIAAIFEGEVLDDRMGN